MDNHLPRVIKEDSHEEDDSAADVIVSKAEEILKNISLYDLIKLSMSKTGTTQQNEAGLKTLLSNTPTNVATKQNIPSPHKRDLSGFFKEAIELQGLNVNLQGAPES
jgi:hypothetical protein